MTSPTFSVVIPSYNYARFLGLTLDSILEQGRSDVEVLVVDDASTDETPELVRRYSDVRYIRLDSNVGASRAWSLGIEAAQGRFLAKIDADDWLLPGWFDSVEQAFEVDPEIGLVAGASVIFRNANDLAVWRVSHRDRLLDEAELRARLLRRFFFRMPSLCLRTDMIRAHESPRSSLRLIHDWEYFIRATKSWKAYLLSRVLGVYRIHENSVTLTGHDQLRHDFWQLLAMIEDPKDPAYLDAHERRILITGLARTYLGIVGPQLSVQEPSAMREHLSVALKIAKRGGPRSVTLASTRLMSGAVQRARRALPFRSPARIRMGHLLPPGYSRPETQGTRRRDPTSD